MFFLEGNCSKIHIDILVITETKLDDTFPNAQFLVPGFSKPFLLDWNRKGGGVMIYVREDIPSKLLTKDVLPSDTKCIFLEYNSENVNGFY